MTLILRELRASTEPGALHLTEAQAAQLATTGAPVIIATDADLAGRLAAERDHWLLAQHNVPTFTTDLPAGTDPSSLLTDHGPGQLLTHLLTARPLVDTLLAERLDNLPADQALPAAATVLASAHPATWDTGVAVIADATGHDADTVRATLLAAVRTWHDDPRPVVADQLAAARDLRARLEHAQAQEQTPQQRWAKLAETLDPRLPQEPDWPALANVMQHLHDEGHDVPALARATVTEDPLGRQPAQDLRYRLVVISPPPQKQVSRHSGIVGTTTEKTRPERREAARRDRSPRAPGR